MTPRCVLFGLLAWLAVSFAAAALGGVASVNAGGFYQELTRPAWAPPAWLFAPVWTLLYFLMGVAFWLIWRERGCWPDPFASADLQRRTTIARG